jgi:hypothetical protein
MIAPLDPSTLVEAVDAVVRRDTPEATHHVDAGHGDYWCLSCRIDDRAGRELFVEYPGRGIAPDVLRVGVYFQDAATASATPAALEVALGSLTAHRDVLQALGAACTFTPGTSTRDDYVFTWATPDLRRWLTASCANRDLVKRWHVRAGVPSANDIRAVISELAPVWRAWNSLDGPTSSTGLLPSLAV